MNQYMIACLAIFPSEQNEWPDALLKVLPTGKTSFHHSFRDAPKGACSSAAVHFRRCLHICRTIHKPGLSLLFLCQLMVGSPIRPLAWEPPYAMGMTLKKKKKKYLKVEMPPWSMGCRMDAVLAAGMKTTLISLYISIRAPGWPGALSMSNHIFKFYWSMLDLQGCVHFCFTAQWFSYTCVFFSIMVYYMILNTVPYDIQ